MHAISSGETATDHSTSGSETTLLDTMGER